MRPGTKVCTTRWEDLVTHACSLAWHHKGPCRCPCSAYLRDPAAAR